MDIPAVARRYAEALYDHAVAEEVAEIVRSDLAAIRALSGNIPDFKAFLENPTITPVTADRTVSALFMGRAHPVTMRFIRFIASKGRLNHLTAVCEAYEQRICDDLGILKVEITAAHDLSADQLSSMKQRLQARYQKQIEATVEVDASLIGGFKVRAGDHIRDFSIFTKLEQFEKRVLNA